jgi:hypothetical protein
MRVLPYYKMLPHPENAHGYRNRGHLFPEGTAIIGHDDLDLNEDWAQLKRADRKPAEWDECASLSVPSSHFGRSDLTVRRRQFSVTVVVLMVPVAVPAGLDDATGEQSAGDQQRYHHDEPAAHGA